MNNSIQNLDMLNAVPSLEEVMHNTHNDEKRAVAVANCKKKQAYRSAAATRTAIIERQSRSRGKCWPLVPYHCPICGHYHATTRHD